MSLREGQIVSIISSRHKFYGKEAVIEDVRRNMYVVRLLRVKKPVFTRLLFDNADKLIGASSKYVRFYVKKNSVKKINGKINKPYNPSWTKETTTLIKKYEKMTKKQIEKEIGHKLISWEKYIKRQKN